MSVPDHLHRFPTRDSIDSLSRRFDLPNAPNMQDWEWEISDSARLDEFVAAYKSGELTDDERFTLMETILQSCEDLGDSLAAYSGWTDVLELLDKNIELHISTVWYWSDLEGDNGQDSWRVTPFVREILERHRWRFDGDDTVGT